MPVRSARRLRFASLLIAAVAVAATMPAAGAASRPSPNALPAFADCGAFNRHMQKLALPHVTSYGLDLSDTRYPDDVRISDLRVGIEGFRPPEPATEHAFAEADDYQSDGRTAVSIAANDLRVLDVAGGRPRPLGVVRLPGEGYSDVLLAGNLALAISPAEDREPGRNVPVYAPGYVPPPPNWTTDLTLIDLAKPAHPRILGTEEITARFVSAHASGDAMRVVLSTDPERRLRFAATDDRAMDRDFVRSTRAADWLPDRQIRDAKGRIVKKGSLLNCADVHHPPEAAGLDLLSILTVDPRRHDPLANGSVFGVLASGDVVAASPTRMYVATTAGWGDAHPSAKRPGRSRIHSFDTTGLSTRYVGSGELEHYVVARGGLSARDGMVRAATTTSTPWSYSSRGKRNNGVVVLRERSGRLEKAGSLGGLSEGRALGVIRWFDDLVAIAPEQKPPITSVPNENAGPLTLVDLSHPAAPRNAGTLNLPGDTAYLEPIGGGLVVAMGARPTTDRLGRDSMEVSTLDLSHLAHARLLDTVSYGVAHAIVDAQDLTWLPDQRTVLLRTQIDSGSACPKGLRCANSPPPPCLRIANCKAHPANLKIDGLVALHVGSHGALRPSGWLAAEGLRRLALLGDHLWGRLRDDMLRLDPSTLKPLRHTRFPAAGRP